MNCRFVSSRDVHNGNKGFQRFELTNKSINNSCMWWCFYMYSTLVQAYVDNDEVQRVKGIIELYNDEYNEQDMVSFFKNSVLQMANIINKEVENQGIGGISKPFIPFIKTTKERDGKLLQDSKEVALHYDA